jgi:hypothetical protein
MKKDSSGLEYVIYVIEPFSMSIRSLVSNVEKYTGQNEITVEIWCQTVDDAFSIETWTDKQKLVIASQQLAGAAATWYAAARTATPPITTWDELKEGLIQRFGGSRSAAVSRLEIARLRWVEGQDLEEHITRFTAIRSRIPDAADGELVSYFRQSLPPEYLSDSLYRDPKTLEQAIAYTRSLHASRRYGLHAPTSNISVQPDPTGPAPMDLDVQQLVRALHSLGFRANNQRSGGGGDSRKCYNCGNRGHIARFCNRRQGNGSGGQRRFQQRQGGPSIDSRTFRLAELAYQIEQQQQGQQQPPDFDMQGTEQSGKGQGQ